MTCDWCHGPIPEGARRDSICCSKRCRQARHRFRTAVGTSVAPGRPRRLAYADPPYPGKAWLYRDHPDFAGEVDHRELVASLSTEYDAWALSTSAIALPAVLALCPPGVRVAAWVRGERPNKQAIWPQNAWEPVIYAGDVRRVAEDLYDASSDVDGRRVDALVHHSRPRITDPKRVIGAKPATFARWIFDLLGATPADELVDVFPGSGGIARAWEFFRAS
ncbi:MAG: hypothetical protein JWQ32_2058 [Marmoricola sp.]|nr:hypothetical protein [Marmoricola sp.]